MRENESLEMQKYCSFSQFSEEEYPHVLYKYKNAREFYPRKGFSKATGGVGDTEYFRQYLNNYIKNFTPERIRENKQYMLTLDSEGRFIVTDGVSEMQPCMSETEKTIYHFLCFIHIAEFWKGLEKIRNVNYEQKPLIIDEFIGKIDASIDPSPYITMAKKINEESVFILTTGG